MSTKSLVQIDDYGSGPSAEWLLIDWSKHLRKVVVSGNKINYVDADRSSGANKTPLIFVHGLSGCWQNWLENIPYFSLSRRVLALDLPGFGASGMPDWKITVDNLSTSLEDFMRALGIDRADLVGNSMGGYIAAKIALDSPKMVNHLVLVSAAGLHTTSAAKMPSIPGPRINRLIKAWMHGNRRKAVSRPRLRNLLLRPVVRYPGKLKPELIYEMMSGAGTEGFIPALSDTIAYNIRSHVHEIHVPTLIIWGRNDRIVPFSSAKRYHQAIEGSQLVVFENTGHVPMLERPARFNRVLDEFLAS